MLNVILLRVAHRDENATESPANMKFTLKLKSDATINFEVKRKNIPGVFRAELNDSKYPLGTPMLMRGALALLVSFY